VDADPWERYGWVMAGIWVIFLIYPISEVWSQGESWLSRGVGLLAIVGFAGAYLRAFILMGRVDTRREVRSLGVRHGLAMVALVFVVATVIGVGALGMTPFLVSLAMFSASLREAVAVAVAVATCALVLPIVGGVPELAAVFVPIVLAVSITTAMVRIMEDRSFERRQHEEELTLAAERDRMARDVHDVLGHSLTVVTVKAELAERLVTIDPARAQAELAEIQTLTRQALSEIRATVAGLRVVRLSDELAGATSALSDAGISVDLPEDPDVVDPHCREVLAWALRESVTNVVRHSAATRCQIELGDRWVRVEDNGVGIGDRAEGSGLRGLRERVAAAGGHVELSCAQPGTRIVVQL
jgi:two-component system, NarL family, sensor histidine kinase DesK